NRRIRGCKSGESQLRERQVTLLKELATTSRGRRWAQSTAMSLVLHATMAGAFGLWLLDRPIDRPVFRVETTWSDPDAAELEPVPVSLIADVGDPGGSGEGAALFEHWRAGDRTDGVGDLDEVSAADW